MKISDQIITKGEYQYSQNNCLVTLKQYIFFTKNEKKYILLRFSNDSDFIVNGIKFELQQFDGNGRKIGKSILTARSISENPGSVFAVRDGFAVDNKCVDFIITVIEIYSGDYVYSLEHGVTTVSYVPSHYESITAVDVVRKGRMVVASKRRGSYTLAFVLAMLMALAVCAIGSFAYYCQYIPWLK